MIPMNYDFLFDSCFKKPMQAAQIRKSWTGLNTFYKLLNLYCGRFVYDLPETCDPRYIELCLCFYGQTGFINQEGDLLSLAPITAGSFNRYGYPDSIQLADYMGKYYGTFIPDNPGNEKFFDCVIIRDKWWEYPPVYRLRWYSDRMTNLQASISAAIANLRGSTIVMCRKEQKKSIERAYAAAGDGLPVIFSYDETPGTELMDKPQVITSPQTPEILKSLCESYDKTLADFCREFGIPANAVINKLSGVGEDELHIGDATVEIPGKTDYLIRADAMQRLSDFSGYPCKVRMTYDIMGTNEKKEDPNNVSAGAKNL